MQARALGIAVAAFLVAVVTVPVEAQQQQQPPPRGQGAARGPQRGMTVPALPADAVEYATGERMNIRVAVLARGLENPWSMAFLPDGSMLITERPGRLRLFRNGELLPDPIAGVPEVRARGLSGLFDVELHPDFARNGYVYLTYDKANGDTGSVLTVARGVFNGRALTDVREIFVVEGASSVSRMIFAPDGKLHVSTFGEPRDMAQNTGGLSGKTLRLNDDGSVPKDNPFAGRDGYRPEIYTLGHRSPEGLVLHEPSGKIWEVEMGPNGGDEVNILEAGANYGWPLVSMGRSYPGAWQPDKYHREGMTDPVVYWMPSISTSGIEFYTGDRLPAWKGNLFVGGMRYGEIPGTGQLARIVFNDNMEEIRRESLLTDLRRRIRDIRQGPDELLYLLTDEADGALLRIEPVE